MLKMILSESKLRSVQEDLEDTDKNIQIDTTNLVFDYDKIFNSPEVREKINNLNMKFDKYKDDLDKDPSKRKEIENDAKDLKETIIKKGYFIDDLIDSLLAL